MLPTRENGCTRGRDHPPERRWEWWPASMQKTTAFGEPGMRSGGPAASLRFPGSMDHEQACFLG
jgi:hypothetical protein